MTSTLSLKTKASKKFITSTTSTTALSLVKQHLPSLKNHQLVFDFGGVWFQKKRLLKTNTTIKQGETLIVFLSERIGQRYFLEESQIIKETNDWLVVHKPATISSVPDRSHLFWNMKAAVDAYCKTGSSHYDCQPINRLDWLVEGLMLFSKNKPAEKKLFNLSQSKKITKGYLSLTPKHTKTILKIKNKLRFKAKAELCPNGKPATTWFLKQENYKKFSIYRAILLAGKRHQIRFHASLKLGSLIGDYFYNSNYKTPLDQVCLIADTLAFWWQGQRYKIKLPNAKNILLDIANKAQLK